MITWASSASKLARRTTPRAGYRLAGLVLAPALLAACTAGSKVTAGSSATVVPPSAPAVTTAPIKEPAALPELPRSKTGRTVAHLENRAGDWTATLGAAGDKGALFITVACVGGGSLAVSYRGSSSGAATIKPACDGESQALQDSAVARGPVKVAVKAGGEQRWSIDITRGGEVL
jgi:hypothetical protein